MTRDHEAWNRRLTSLIEQGLTVADAARWANTLSLSTPGSAAEIAVAYRDAGFTAVEAVPWYDAVTFPARAVRFANAGWEPRSASLLKARFRPSEWSTEGALDNGVIADWLNTGLRPPWVLLYINAGVKAAEAAQMEARRCAGSAHRSELMMLAALRGGTR